jgi:uncharacterized protein YecT (DUF1311 family)
LAEANSAYETGNKDAAKQLYMQAAQKGSAEAHYSMCHKFTLPDEKYVFHLTKAARKGHTTALENALGRFLIGGGLDNINPKLALEIYNEAKASNPALSLYKEEKTLRIMKMSVEMSIGLGPFDAGKFREKYKIREPDREPGEIDGHYFIWSLAEEACRGGRFGKPNRKLAFQLIIRGGGVTAEFESAIEEAYQKWKNDEPYQFVIDDHITSGIGGAFCSGRKHDAVVEECQREINEISDDLPAQDRDRLAKSYGAFTKFIDEKAWTEEGHGGTGWMGWTFDSLIEHKREYVKLVKSVSKGFNPDFQHGYQVTDQRLNETYKALIADLKKASFKPGHTRITHDMVIDVQRLWIPYRDSTAELFSSLNPAVDIMTWKSWLTDARTKQIEELIRLKKDL